MKKISICLLASGNLGLIALKHLYSKQEVTIVSVFTNKNSSEILDFCNVKNIPCFSGNPRNESTTDFVSNIQRPDILLSVNYLFIIEEDLIKFPKDYAINIHGSLLPRYRGRTPHVWSIINGENKTGITAHLITQKCDEGDIILQKIIPITKNDTGGSILRKYNCIYPELIDELFELIKKHEIKLIPQDETKATYFEKRTPEDGHIDWNWQKERIYNWVRAMAPPEYPGAFSFYNGKKIIFSKIEFSDEGFYALEANGTVKKENGDVLFVKTPNGVVKAFTTDNRQQTTDNRQQTTDNRQQTTDNFIIRRIFLCQVLRKNILKDSCFLTPKLRRKA